MKQFSQFALGKWVFASIKWHLCFTKIHLANHRRLFLILMIQIKRKKNSERSLLNKASDLWLLYLSKTSPNR